LPMSSMLVMMRHQVTEQKSVSLVIITNVMVEEDL